MKQQIEKLNTLLEVFPEKLLSHIVITSNGSIQLLAKYSDELQELCEQYPPFVRQCDSPTQKQYLTKDVSVSISMVYPKCDLIDI